MITTKKELKSVLNYEKSRYYNHKPYNGFYFIDNFIREPYTVIWKYQKLMRRTEYYYNNKMNPFCLVLYLLLARRYHIMSETLGVDIPINVFGKGLVIDHYGCIIVNGRSRVGDNCRLHGNNCIGNKGEGRELEVPIIGDDFDLGVGSSVLGAVLICNNVTVGANAVVTKDIADECVVIGTPARRL